MKKSLSMILALAALVGFFPEMALSAGGRGETGSHSPHRTYRIRINGRVYGTSWHMLITARFAEKSFFDSVSVPSNEIRKISSKSPIGIGSHWSGVRGWVQVEKDGLHYDILTRQNGFGGPGEVFDGIRNCEKASAECPVTFSTGSP